MSLASLCNTSATFQHKTVAADTLGLGHNETFATAYTVLVSLQPASGRTIEEFARAGFQVSHVAYMADVMTLAAGDKMLVGSTPYIVQGPQRDMGGRTKAYSVPLLQKDQ